MRAGDSRMEAAHHHHEGMPVEAGHRRHGRHRPRYPDDDKQRSSPLVWMAVILCTLLIVGVIVVGAAVFVVYIVYKPQMPYMLVTSAQLERLEYSAADGVISDIQVPIGIVARNTNSKADVSFYSFDIAVGFHGTTLARLRAMPFSVARENYLPLPYVVGSKGAVLDAAGKRAMEAALSARVVPITLTGKARTRWKMGIFLKVSFWTRINCHLYFDYPGGAVRPIDHDSCRSKSP